MSNQQPDLAPNQSEQLAPDEGAIYQGEQRPPSQSPALGTQEFTQDQLPGSQPPAAPVEPTTVKIDSESLAAITAASQPAKEPTATDPVAQKRLEEMSPEEIQEVLTENNVTPWQSSKEFVSTISNQDLDDITDAQVSAFQAMYNSAVNHGLTMSSLISNQQNQDVMDRIEPLEHHYTKVEQKRAFDGFYDNFPDLKQYPKAVSVAAADLQKNIKDGRAVSPQGDAAIYQALANQTVLTLQGMGVQVAQGNQTSAQSPSVVPFQPQPQLGYTGPVANAGVPTMAAGITPGRSQQGGVGGQPNNPDADIYGKSG